MQAIRGEAIAGLPAIVPVLGRKETVGDANRDDALGWFGEMVADHLCRELEADAITLVPVPDDRADAASRGKPRTTKVAEAIGSRGGDRFEVADVLRWRKPLVPPDAGGPRFALDLLPELVLVGPAPATAVLVDLLLTTSNHMRACYAFLAHNGIQVVRGVCVGRTVSTPMPDAFEPIDEQF